MMIECISAVNRIDLDRLVLDRLLDNVDEAGVCRFLYLSPTKRKCRDMAGKLQEQRPIWKPRFLVPKELAEELVTSQSKWRKRPISDELKVLLIRNILDTETKEESFSKFRFRTSSTPLGIARHVAVALDDLAKRDTLPDDKRAGIRPDIVDALSRIQSIYYRKLDHLSLYDPVHLPKLAVQALSEKERAWKSSTDLLVLDGFVAPDQIETSFLLELAEFCEHISVVVTLPATVVEHVKQHGWKTFPNELLLYQFGESLFQGLIINQAVKDYHFDDLGTEKQPVDKALHPAKYPDRTAEVQGIARTIKKLFFLQRANELAADDFHILVPRMEPYYQLFVELFPRYGIPFNITRGIPLSSLPATNILVALMDAIISRDRPTLFELFSLELVANPSIDSLEGFAAFIDRHSPILDGSRIPINQVSNIDVFTTSSLKTRQLDAWTLDRICRNLGFTGGKDFQQDWLQPVVYRINGLVASARRAQDRSEEERLAEELGSALIQMWLLEKEFFVFDHVSNSQETSQVPQCLLELLQRYKVQPNLVKSLTTMEVSANTDRRIMIEKNVHGIKEAINVLNSVVSDLEIVGRGSAGIEEIRELFFERCARVMIQEAGTLAGVSISQMLEIRNIAPKVVFAAGLTADDFPITPGNNFVLSRGLNSEHFAKSLAEGRFIMTQILENSGTVFLSFPESDGTDSLEMSPLLRDLIHGDNLTNSAAISEPGDQYAPFEVLRETGKAWAENVPLSWDRIGQLIAQIPIRSESTMEDFQQHLRSTFLSHLERYRTDQLGLYDGSIQDQSVLSSINGVMDNERYAYSISMLNDYQRCPMLFFFKRMLGLELLEEVPEEVEAAEFGSAVHEILATFYREWRNSGKGRITPGNRINALSIMQEISDSVLAGFRFMNNDRLDSAAAYNRITRGLYTQNRLNDDTFRANVERGQDLPSYRRGVLRMLADYEASLDLPFYPIAEEFGFGFGDGPLLVLTGENGEHIRIRGKVDRIDIYGDQAIEKAKYAWIIDYKTGRCPIMKSVREGGDLQLPVYILALREGLSSFKGKQVGACFVSLRPYEESLRKRILYSSGFTKEMLRTEGKDSWKLEDYDLEMFRSWIVAIDSSIRRGHFPRSLDSSACTYCDYISACFRDEYRVTLLTDE